MTTAPRPCQRAPHPLPLPWALERWRPSEGWVLVATDITAGRGIAPSADRPQTSQLAVPLGLMAPASFRALRRTPDPAVLRAEPHIATDLSAGAATTLMSSSFRHRCHVCGGAVARAAARLPHDHLRPKTEADLDLWAAQIIAFLAAGGGDHIVATSCAGRGLGWKRTEPVEDESSHERVERLLRSTQMVDWRTDPYSWRIHLWREG